MKKLTFTSALILVFVLIFGCSGSTGITKGTPWEIIPVTDDFGDKIDGRQVIRGVFDGTMSNSATTNAPLKVAVIVEDSVTAIELYEYGTYRKTLPELSKFQLKLKPQNGEVIDIPQFYVKGLIFDFEGKLLFRSLMSEKNPIKAFIDLKSEGTKYNFEIDPVGFRELFTSQSN